MLSHLTTKWEHQDSHPASLALEPLGLSSVTSGFSPRLCPPTDADECVMFGPSLCQNGRCLNTVPGYICLCNPGYHYNAIHRECEGEDAP